ncbi:MAG: M48 family metallopeptidase [Gammaproteobacteria bacterium]|nr:M48 family metallopeptidase [Gammaproteobacteria bacterium]
MDYEPKIIPEGINTSREHPLREFFLLVGGISLVVVLLVSVLAASADFLLGYIPVEKENQWFAQRHDSSAGDTGPAAEREVEAYLQQLSNRLRDPARPGFRFDLSLLENPAPNAFVLPGGHIVVTSGLLDAVESENGLAMVVAHEMAHQYHRHPLRSLGRGVVIALALVAISGADGSGLAQQFVGGTAVLTQLGYSREQEREADATGLELLLRQYGHSGGAVEFFAAVRELPLADDEPPVFLSTHPGIDERIDMLQAHARHNDGPITPLPAVIGEYLAQVEQ